MADVTLLEKLSNAIATAGAESEVRTLLREALKESGAALTVDALGNLIAHKSGSSTIPLRVMVTAHMDEPGFMVSSAGEGGPISVMSVGRHDLRYLAGARVALGSGKTVGVVQQVPIHRSRGSDSVADVKDLSIDTGASGKASVKVGDRAGFLSSYTALTERIVRGKALDRSAACALLVALVVGEAFPFDLHAVFSAQRTLGGRGAKVAASRLTPEVVIGISGNETDDLPRTPDDVDQHATTRLGGGPILYLADKLGAMDRKLINHLTLTAQQAGITCQLEVDKTLSDAGRVGVEQVGVVTASISVPVRYLGSPNALLDLTDLENTERLLRQALLTLTPEHIRQ
jgi:endoglucanase